MKRFSLILCLVLAASLVLVGSAFANFGPHGGYATDTDSCAGCHRAHTSFSSVKFATSDPGPDPDNPGSEFALLVGGATSMTEFCYACHGDQAPGASTNVQKGVFDGGPSSDFAGGALSPVTVAQPYQTYSTFAAPLNGGGMESAAKNWDWDVSGVTTAAWAPVTSAHNTSHTSIIWGAGNGADKTLALACTDCHDPHGSTNYRLLKDSVNGLTVGGYTEFGPYDFVANPYVSSVETGYPVAGWSKGTTGAAEIDAYKPNYTNGGNVKATQDGGLKSLSTWCAACHENYNDKSNEQATDPGAVNLATGAGSSGASKNYLEFEGDGTVNAKPRHRHPVNITLEQGDIVLQIPAQKYAESIGLDPRLPLEVNTGVASVRQYNVGCLTCHLAHGSSQDMQGWAASHLVKGTNASWFPALDATPGVDPDKADWNPMTGGPTGTSALLRADSRGVCERCHNK